MRVIPEYVRSDHDPRGPRVTVPLEVVQLNRLDALDRSETDRYVEDTAKPIQDVDGVDPSVVSHPDDIPLIHRAVRGRWNIGEERRKLVIDTMARIVEKSRDDRTVVNAAKVLIAADKIDADAERKAGETVNNNLTVNISPESIKTLPMEQLLKMLGDGQT